MTITQEETQRTAAVRRRRKPPMQGDTATAGEIDAPLADLRDPSL